MTYYLSNARKLKDTMEALGYKVRLRADGSFMTRHRCFSALALPAEESS